MLSVRVLPGLFVYSHIFLLYNGSAPYICHYCSDMSLYVTPAKRHLISLHCLIPVFGSDRIVRMADNRSCYSPVLTATTLYRLPSRVWRLSTPAAMTARANICMFTPRSA